MTIVINNKPYIPKLIAGQVVWVSTSYYEFMHGVVNDIVLTIQQDGTIKARYNVTCRNEDNESEVITDLEEDDVCVTELEARRRQLRHWSHRHTWLQGQLDDCNDFRKTLMDRILALEHGAPAEI